MKRSLKPLEKSRVTRSDARQVPPQFAHVVQAFSRTTDVTQGKLMSSYGLKVNGKIFAMFGRAKFVTKLPRSRVDGLVNDGKGEHFDPGHGRLMKEWIAIDSNPDTWVELAKEAYEFVKRLSSKK